MKKNDYLRLAIKNKNYSKKSWVISLFSVTRTKSIDVATAKDVDAYRLFHEVDGVYFLDPINKSIVKLVDSVPNEPLYNFHDPITVDTDLCSNVLGEPIETCMGNLLVNLCAIAYPLKNKMPFITGYVDIQKIESKIAEKLKDTPDDDEERDPNAFYVDELIDFQDALNYLQSFTQLAIWSGSKKTMTPPPDIEEYKKKLESKYGDKLIDPVYFAAFEKELEDHYKEYLKGDPNLGIYMSGKQLNPSAKKRFLTFGYPGGFRSTPTKPIKSSLLNGWPTDRESYAEMINDSRSGSYARGMETVDGGVATKKIIMATGNSTISKDECDTERGLHRTYTKYNIKNLSGRYVRLGKAWKLVSSIAEANTFVDKPIELASPQFCTKEGDIYCKRCTGETLGANPSGILTAGTNVGGIILNAAMKAMHGTVLATTRFIPTKHIT